MKIDNQSAGKRPANWRAKLHEIIFEANTREGKLFDVLLLIFIILSILTVMLDSVDELHEKFGTAFFVLEWVFTIIFTLEYFLRIISLRKPFLYVVSFLGIIDLLAIIPMYISLLLVGAQSLLVLRALRLLRIFRIFKLSHFVSEMNFLSSALKKSMKKISIFMLFVLTLVIILGSVMYLVEPASNGFSSIPNSIYWAIVTITTVGYGDMAPITPLGKILSSFIMLLGYGIIAVPTGIITSEMAVAIRSKNISSEVCPSCGKEGHEKDAKFCKFCSSEL
ncbi:MAG: ion transporter [Ferruginibacter sp.]